MKIYLVRHGETTLNARGCYYGRTDVCLSGRGRRQAEELRNFFGQVPLDAVVTSPLKRAAETAEIILSRPRGPWRRARGERAPQKP